MLVALLSSLEPAQDGATCPRAFLRVTGRSVIERQADIALALGSERIVCFGAGITPELLTVQHMVERQGKRFHVLRTIDALRAQVTAADELLVLSDGVLPDYDVLAEVLGGQRGVVAFPAEPGLAAGFERLDRDRAWSGVLRCGGAELERMADLPHDIDPLSALMRAALQAGRTVRLLPGEILAEERWPMVNNADQARQVGRRAVARTYAPAGWVAPGHALIDRLVQINAERMLRRDPNAAILAGLAAFIALGGVIAAGSGFLVSAFLMIGLAAAVLRGWTKLATLRNAKPVVTGLAQSIGIDLALFGALAAHGGEAGLSTVGYPVLIASGLLYLLAQIGPPVLRPLGSDKIAWCLVLAMAASAGVVGDALQVISLVTLGACLFAQRPIRLTGA